METSLEKRITAAKVLKILFWLALAALSLTLFRRYAVSVDTYQGIFSSLDEKRSTVFSLITASTAVSTAITLIPGDAGTPIAQQVAQLSEYFIIVLGALYLEKYLLTILGFLSSVILVPAACALSAVHELRPGNGWMKRLAITLLVVGLASVLVIPASVGVSNSIDRTFHESIQGSIEATTQVSEQLEQEAEGDGSLWGSLSNAAQSVVGGVSSTVEWAKTALKNVIESVTIMLVTNCVIPIAVLVFFVWAVKQIIKALYARPALPPERDEAPRRRFRD